MKKHIRLNKYFRLTFFDIMLHALIIFLFIFILYAYRHHIIRLVDQKIIDIVSHFIQLIGYWSINVLLFCFIFYSVHFIYIVCLYAYQSKTTYLYALKAYIRFKHICIRLKQLRVALDRIRASYKDIYPNILVKRDKNMYILYLYKNHWFKREQVEKNTDFFKSVFQLSIYKLKETYNAIILYFIIEEQTVLYSEFIKWQCNHKALIGYQNMEPVYWNFNKQPHLFGIGVTGSGKSNFLKVLADSLVYCNAKLLFADGKRVELIAFKKQGYTVYTDDFLKVFKEYHSIMTNRYIYLEEQEKQHYRQLDLDPYFLIVDELGSIFANLSNKAVKNGEKSEYKQVLHYMTDILRLGRSAGVFLVVFMQDPKADTIDTRMRLNFNQRCLLGKVTESTAYDMVYGSGYRNLEPQKTGSGYYLNEEGIPTVFQIPLFE